MIIALTFGGEFVCYFPTMGIVRQLLYEHSSREFSIYTTVFLYFLWFVMAMFSVIVEYKKRSVIVLDYVFYSCGALFWGVVFLYMPFLHE